MPSPVSVRVSRVRIRVRLSFRLCDATDMKVKLCICACVRYNVVDFRRLHLDVDKRLILVGRRRTVPALPLAYMLQWRRAVMTPAVETRHDDDAVEIIDGGSYGVVARPLFGARGPLLSLARPLLSSVKHYTLHYCTFIQPL